MERQSQKKRRSGQNAGLWKVMAVVFPMGLAGAAAAYLTLEILINTGPWGVPLLFLYLAVLLAIGFYIPHKRAKNEFHFRAGDELFFAAYPKELKKALQKAEEAGIDPERMDALERCRALAGPLPEENPLEADHLRRRGRMFEFFSGLLVAAPIPVLIYRAVPALGRLLPLSFRSDFTGLFSLIGAALLLLGVVLIIRRRDIPYLTGATAVVLLLNVWACFVTFSLTKKTTLPDILISFVCFVLFILGKVLLPRLAGDLRSPRQKAADRREFNLELFTLRVIDEEELKYRLTKD